MDGWELVVDNNLLLLSPVPLQIFEQQYRLIGTIDQVRMPGQRRPARKRTVVDKCVELLKRREIVKPTLILLALFILQQLSGAYVIIFYAVSLFQKVGGRFEDYGYINEYGALVLLGLIRFIMSILASG